MPSRNLSWADMPSERARISGNSYRRVDFLNLWAKGDGGEVPRLTPAIFQYDDGWPPPKRQILASGGHYVIELAIMADDCDTKYWSVSFNFEPKRIETVNELADQIRDIRLKHVRA
jgi:hypothetical protein